MSYRAEIDQLWNKEQTQHKLDELNDSPIYLSNVISQFCPDHIHWRNGGVPLFFSMCSDLDYGILYHDKRTLMRFLFDSYHSILGMPGRVFRDFYYPEER